MRLKLCNIYVSSSIKCAFLYADKCQTHTNACINVFVYVCVFVEFKQTYLHMNASRHLQQITHKRNALALAQHFSNDIFHANKKTNNFKTGI